MPLDEADKAWISQQFDRSGLVMTQELGKFESVIDERFVQFESAVNQRFVQFGAEIDQRFEFARIDGKEQLERVETNLLTAFHKWASPLDARVRSHTSNLRAIDLKLEELRIGFAS